MASGTGLFDIHKKEYHQDLLKNLEIDSKTQLGELVDYESTSPLSEKGAQLLGLPSGIPVVPCHPDGALNQLGSSATEKGIMTLSVGTSGAMRLTTDKPILNFEQGNWCYYGATKSWLSGAATSGCCNCVDYYKQLLFSDTVSYKEIEDNLKEDKMNVPIFLPFLFGERCPGWDDGKNASFLDCTPENTTRDYYHAVLEGVLFNLYQCFDNLRTVETIKTIKLSGGILQSKTWKQMCADIFGIEIEEDRVKQCSLFGGAKLAASVLDTHIPEHTSHNKILPNMEMHTMYMKKYARYSYWYNNTKEKV
jgi:gluconokinase